MEQPHYTDLLTKEFFEEHYVKNKMSFPKISEMFSKQGKNIAIGTIYKYAKKLGIGRSISEGRRNDDDYSLDYNVSFLNEALIESVDGFLLGDGGIAISNNKCYVGRARCSTEYEIFAKYMMDFFQMYNPNVASYKQSSMKSGIVWQGQTRFHPDFYEQYVRWYPETNGKREKQPPEDIRITPKSVMIWYLGDGSVVQCGKNSIILRISTDSFLPEKVDFLAQKLKEKGIECHRSNENRIYVEAKGIAPFFDFIGRVSPVECYKYKFDLPEWRQGKRMSEVAKELGMDYNVLSYWVKSGKVECLRSFDKGRPRFLPEHIEKIKEKKNA